MRVWRRLMILAAMFLVFGPALTVRAADSGYREIDILYSAQVPVGGMVFTYEEDGDKGILYAERVSTGEKKAIVKLPLGEMPAYDNIVTNGKILFFVKTSGSGGSAVYRVDVKRAKKKVVLKVPKDIRLIHAHEGKVYYLYDWSSIRRLTVSGGKTKKLFGASGKYFLKSWENYLFYRNEKNNTVCSYNVSKKKAKRIAQNVTAEEWFQYGVYGKRFWYVRGTGSKAVVYSVKPDGTGTKKRKTISGINAAGYRTYYFNGRYFYAMPDEGDFSWRLDLKKNKLKKCSPDVFYDHYPGAYT